MKLDKGLAKGIVKTSFIILFLVALGFFVLNFVVPVIAPEGASIWTTDAEGNIKSDFDPGDIVYIHGSGFNFDSQVNITITKPNGSQEFFSVMADGDGEFVYAYDLDGIEGEYRVDATDGENFAYTTFTDSRTIISATLNGASSAVVLPTTSITATVTVTTTSGSDWASTRYRIEGGSWVCVDTPDHVYSSGMHTDTESFNINAPSSLGTYDVSFQAYSGDSCGTLGSTYTLTNGIIVVNTAGPILTSTLLNDGFEGSPWDGNWNDIVHDWYRDDSPIHSGSYSASARNDDEGYFTSDDLDASNVDVGIVVDFWFRKDDTESTDFTLYHYNGATYNLITELDGLGRDDTWLHYTALVTDNQYFKSNFRIRFDATLESYENVWVDDVKITAVCTDADGDGVCKKADCNDNDASIYPGATEVCNNKDDDCDSQIDEGGVCPVLTYYCDGDSDGYLSSTSSGTCNTFNCVPQRCSETVGNDCNDNNANIHPGASDSNCNGIDENCNSVADDGYIPTPTSCGLGVCANTGQLVCVSGATQNTCVAGEPTGLDNNCNGIDENCNGQADENYVPDSTCFLPGVCAAGNIASSCNAGVETPCKTGLPTQETCNGLDDNCNGVADDGLTAPLNSKQDGVCVGSTQTCSGAGGWVDDYLGVVNYENPEVSCDKLDNDCNGITDDGCPSQTWNNVQTGQVFDTDRGLTIKFTNLPSPPAPVTVNEITGTPPGSSELFGFLGKYYEIDSSMESGTFTVTLVFSYPDATNDGWVDGTSPPVNELYLRVYYYDGTNWVDIDGTVDPTANTVTVTGLTHFTPFTLIPAMTVDAFDITPDWAKGSQTNIGILDLQFTNTGAADTITQVKVTSKNTNDLQDVLSVKLWEDSIGGTLLGTKSGIDFFLGGGAVTFNGLAVNVPTGVKHLFVSYDTPSIGGGTGDGDILDAKINAGDITMTNSGSNVGALDPAGSTTLDTYAPTVGITTAPGIYTGTINLGATATDVESGVQKVAFYNGVPGAGTYLGETTIAPYSYSWSTTPADDSTYTIWVRGYDNVGNYVDVDTVTITVDNTKPNTVINPIATPTNVNAFSVTGTATDATTNIVNVQWKYSTNVLWSGTTPSDGAFNSPSENFNFYVGPLADGTYTVDVRATDAAGNTEDPKSSTFCIDTVKPSATGTPTHSDLDSGVDGIPPLAGWDDDTSVVFMWTAATDPAPSCGLDHYEVQVSTNGGDWSGSANVGLALTYSVAGVDGSNYKVRVRAVDSAGNNGDWTESATIYVDTTAPVINDIAIASDKPTYFYEADTDMVGGNDKIYFNNVPAEGADQVTTTTVSWTDTNKDRAFGDTAFGDSPADENDVSPSHLAYSIEAGYGTVNGLTVTVVDKAGNRATYSLNYLQDNTAPASGVLSLLADTDSSGDGIVPITGYYDDTGVDLSWTASSDADSGLPATSYRLWNDAGTTVPTAWQTPASYTDLATNEGGATQRTVTLQTRDNVGNMVTTTVGVYVDLTNPSIGTLSLVADTDSGTDGVSPQVGYYDDTGVDLSWTACTDANLEVSPYKLWNDVPGTITGWLAGTTNNDLLTSEGGATQRVVTLQCLDKAGRTATTTVGVYVDLTEPNTALDVYLPDPTNDNTPTYTGTATDTLGTDVINVEYRVDGGTWSAATATDGTFNSQSEGFTFTPTLSDGSRTIETRATDRAGNVETTYGSDTLFIDTVKPDTSDDAPSGWQTSAFSVTLNPSDPALSSGIAWTKYCVDTTNICVPGTDYVAPILFNIDGQFYLRYHSADNAGNVQDVVSRFVQLDTVPPTTTDDTDSLTPWYATDRTVTLTCSDATSGCSKNYYCVDITGTCVPDTLGTSVSVTCPDGNICLRYVRYYSVDVAGNTEGVKTSYLIKIDKEKPTGYSVTVDGVATTEYMAGTVTVRCDGATDGSGSGVDVGTYSFEYSLDGSSWFAMPGCTGITSACSWNTAAITDYASSLRCTVDDNVGNTGDWAQTDYAGIDNTKPTSAITYPSNGEWLSKLVEGSPISITGTAVDSNSGVQKVEISTSDVGGWNLATGTTSWTYSWALPADGTYTISSRATDSAKPSPNVESTYTITVHVDSTNPTVSITLPTEPADASPGWYKGTISISHTETDNMALKYCEYKYNSGSWSTVDCNTPFSFDTNLCPDGANTCTVDVRVWDMADNFATDSKTFSVDNSAPVITTVLLSDNTVKEGTIITITSDGTDPQTLQSCAAFTYDSLGNLIAGSEQALGYTVPNECDGPYTLPTGIPDGTYQIRVRARNHAGTDSWSSADIIVDDTSPTISNTAVSDSIVQSGTIVDITTTITDNLAGIDPATTKAHIQKPDGTDVDVVNLVDDGSGCDAVAGDNNYCGQWIAAGTEGTYYIDITASDNASNSQTQDNGATVIVDNTPPTVYYVFPGKNWVGKDQTFYVDALASDDIGFDTPTYCAVGIDDGSGYKPIGSALYNPATGKCSGYVTVNDTFNPGSVGLFVIIQDAAGNSAENVALIGIENTPPIRVTFDTTPTATSFIKTGQIIAFNISFEQGMSDLKDGCYISLNNTDSKEWPIQNNRCAGDYVVPSGLSDGEVLFMLKVENNAGNWLEDSINFRLDNSAPVKNMISPVYGGSYSAYIPFILNITDYAGVDDSTAQFRITNDLYCLEKGPFNPFNSATWICALKFDSLWVTLNNSTKPIYWYNYSTENMTDGTYYFGTKVCDILGTCGDPNGSIIIDKTAPTWPSGAKLTVTYSPYDKDGNVTLSWPAASDELSGVDHYNIYVFNSTGHLVYNNSTNQISFNVYNLTDGYYTFNVTAVDKAIPGNENSGLKGSTTVQRSCSVDETCTPTISVSGGGGGGGGGALPPITTTTTTVPTTTTLPSGAGGAATTTTMPGAAVPTTTTTLPPAPLSITGLIALVTGNTVYQILLALAVVAVLLTIFRYKWLPRARKGLSLLGLSSKKAKPRKK